MKKLILLIVLIYSVSAGAQTLKAGRNKTVIGLSARPVSLKDSVVKYSTMVAAYKRMSGFPKYDSVRYKIVRLHDSAQVIANHWSELYEDSVYRAKMKN